jgi:hypothetical protein
MTPPHSSLLSPHSFAVVVSVEEQKQDKCEEEEDGVHDAERPGCLKHGTVLIDIECPHGAAVSAIVPEGSEVDVYQAAGEVGAIRIVDASKLIICGNECANKAEVDESHK